MKKHLLHELQVQTDGLLMKVLNLDDIQLLENEMLRRVLLIRGFEISLCILIELEII